MTFYRISSDMTLVDTWYLKGPVDVAGNEVDARDFTECQIYESGVRLQVPLRRPGGPVDFTLADFDMPVVSERIAEIFLAFCSDVVQFLPVTIDSHRQGYAILNVLRSCACVDEERSKFTKWTAADGRREKVGDYRMFSSLVLDAGKLEGAHIARVREWMVALVVSEELKYALQDADTTGIAFELLT